MEIELTSTMDKMEAEGLVESIPPKEVQPSMNRIQQTMGNFDVEFKAMQAQSEQITSEVSLTF
ncbi:MAG: hypothetical protein ABUK01_06255 [Leptospirales bacterium]